jgi:phage terminase small subunit
MSLSPKQERFCVAYAKLGDGAKAAREAGYSRRTAASQASALLTKHEISERVRELMEGYAGETLAALSRIDKQREILTDGADRAIKVLFAVLDDPETNADLRVKIALAVMDRAGHAPRPEQDNKETTIRIIGGLPD